MVLTDTNDMRVVVEDFFTQDTPPALVTTDGVQISAVLAGRLAGLSAQGQTVTGGTDAASVDPGDPIGTVNTASGQAYIIRVDGTRV